MSANALTVATESGGVTLASFGSGNGSRAANARSAGRGGRLKGSTGSINSVRGRARRLAAQPGRGKASRRALLAEIEAAASGRARPTNRQIQQWRGRLFDLANG